MLRNQTIFTLVLIGVIFYSSVLAKKGESIVPCDGGVLNANTIPSKDPFQCKNVWSALKPLIRRKRLMYL